MSSGRPRSPDIASTVTAIGGPTILDAENPKRAAIVEAACALFLENGYGATSMDQITAEAAVSKRTVYSHFDGKEALFEGVMNGLCIRLAGGCPLGDTWDGPPEEILTIAGRWLLTLITRPEAVALDRVVTGESARFPRLGEVFFRMGPGRMIEQFAGYLATQHTAGTLAAPDPHTAATRLLEMIRGPIHMPLLLGLRQTPDDAEIERSVDEAVRLFIAAHRPD
jgi:AcrR family transcriptional regulator